MLVSCLLGGASGSLQDTAWGFRGFFNIRSSILQDVWIYGDLGLSAFRILGLGILGRQGFVGFIFIMGIVYMSEPD